MQFAYLGPGTRLVVALHFSGTSVEIPKLAVAGTGFFYLLGASQSSASAPTGTWSSVSNAIDCVSTIEMVPPVTGWMHAESILPRSKDYFKLLAISTLPRGVFPSPAATPKITSDNSIGDDRPIRPDILGVVLKATTSPVWPQAPPVAVVTPPKWIMDPTEIMPDRRW